MRKAKERYIIPSLMTILSLLLTVVVFTAFWYEHRKTYEDFIEFAATESKIVLDTVVEAIHTTAGVRRYLEEQETDDTIVRTIVREYGTGRLLQRLGRYGVFDYLVCQDEAGIIAAYGVEEISRIAYDPFLSTMSAQDNFRTRMLPGTPTRMEAARLFEVEGNTYYLRVCMPLITVEHLQERLVRRLAILGAVFLFVILLLIIYLVSVNNALLIARERDRITRRVDIMQRQLRQQERLHAMGRLAAGVAHEIRNPLNAAQILVQRLSMEVEATSGTREKFQKFTRIMRAELDRLSGIVKEFVEFARARKVVFTRVDPVRFTHDICVLERGEASARGITLTDEIPATLQPVDADKEQFHQALINVIQNAIDAAGDGGEVHVRVRQKDGMTQWCIEDTGVGMDEETREKAFDLYFTTKETGMGLGLAITQRIVQAHAGEIRIVPRTPRGTCVEIEIPDRRRHEDTTD